MESNQTVIAQILQNGVARITLNRPEIHNAFDDVMIKQLTQAIEKIDCNDSVRVLVLDAKGKSFSAGADLNWMKKMAGYSWDQNYHDSLKLAGLMQTLYQCSKTTIALIQGAAFGGGVGLAACCDIALASNKAVFSLSEVKLGLIPAVISPYVVKAIGERNAKRLFATAEKFDAEDALRIQLIHKIYSVDTFADDCEQYIQAILNNGPEAIKQSKRLVDFVIGKPITEELILETAQRISDIRSSSEGKEGVSAFLDKREADWTKIVKTEI